ncbi:hypothetical protein Trydic_g16689 [Trypoxylus dichotomus]
MVPVLYSVAASPPCRAVLMLAKAIGLPLEVKTLDLGKQEQLKPEFLEIPIRQQQTKTIPDNLKTEVRNVYGLLEMSLEGNELCGDNVTVADIQLLATISTMDFFIPLEEKYPNIILILERQLYECIMAPVLYQVISSPPCRAVFMLARAIGLKLDLKDVNLAENQHLTPRYLKLNPQHTIPLLDDDGFILWDSHAINVYLISKYAKDSTLYPEDIHKRAIIDQRLHFDSGVAFAVLRRISGPLRLHQTKIVPENLKAEVREVYGFLDAFLEEKTWVCGDSVTLADIHLVATISSVQLFEPLGDKYVNIKRWLDNCSKEDWYQANVKGLEIRNKLFTELMN